MASSWFFPSRNYKDDARSNKHKICNWSLLTVITQILLLHVQLHNSTSHFLYKYCTNFTSCNWTVLKVITQKLLLHVQLHNSTTYLLYNYCTNCTVYNWTVLTVITRKLPLHIQLHNSTETLNLFSSEVECSRLFVIVCIYIHSHIKRLDPSNSRYWLQGSVEIW